MISLKPVRIKTNRYDEIQIINRSISQVSSSNPFTFLLFILNLGHRCNLIVFDWFLHEQFQSITNTWYDGAVLN